jgi:pSer/pThr/pTyr-binding forkhead associated (FHA) protein
MSGIVLLILRFVMAIALYAFIGWAVYTLWRDMKRQKELIESQTIPEIKLVVEIGEKIESHSYTVPEIVVGRESTCDLELNANTVSAEHTRLSYHHQNWWVEDLGSRNGTFLNFDKVASPAILVSGDQLQLGQALIKISIQGDYAERPESDSN